MVAYTSGDNVEFVDGDENCERMSRLSSLSERMSIALTIPCRAALASRTAPRGEAEGGWSGFGGDGFTGGRKAGVLDWRSISSGPVVLRNSLGKSDRIPKVFR